jgi:hypothetical protein
LASSDFRKSSAFLTDGAVASLPYSVSVAAGMVMSCATAPHEMERRMGSAGRSFAVNCILELKKSESYINPGFVALIVSYLFDFRIHIPGSRRIGDRQFGHWVQSTELNSAIRQHGF